MAGPLPASEEARRWHAIGTHGSIATAARSIGLAPGVLRNWANGRPRETQPEAPVAAPVLSPAAPPAEPVKPHYTVRLDRIGGRDTTRVLAIGDAHDGPKVPKDRFRWMGALAADIQPDVIVQIGDFLSLDSLCRYDDNASLKGKAKPSLKEDLESFKEALAAFDEGLGGFRPERHVTLGNHEDRIWSFTNRTPEVADLLTENLHTILTDRGWSYSPFGVLHFYGGVGFTHAPLNTMGKPYGGLYAENQVARDALHDVVYGHSHKRVDKPYPKMGHRKLTVVNLGCALPDGHVEEYARHSLTGWSYGVYDLTIRNGGIEAAHWIPMATLQDRYA
ncbi:MAG: metallophosphoesterase [Phycisphaerae bacterium]